MNSFSILERDVDIQKSLFLEASAGTGKTFSIENIVLRLLLELKNPCALQDVLIVTFTKAATQELKKRLRLTIENALKYLSSTLRTGAIDYLEAIMEQGPEVITQAKKILKQALNGFDEAQIFTIHSFCYQALHNYPFEADCLLEMDPENFHEKELIQNIKDYFKTQMSEQDFSPRQVQFLLNHFNNDLERLHQQIMEVVSRRLPIEQSISFATFCQELNSIIHAWQEKYGLDEEKLSADLFKIAPNYAKTCDRQKQIKEELKQALLFFSHTSSPSLSVNIKISMHCLHMRKGYYKLALNSV